jgi:superfamily II DNA or RNA helicase
VTRIIPALGPVIYDYDYRTAKTDGVIVDFDLINVEIGISTDDWNRLQARLDDTLNNTSVGSGSIFSAADDGSKSTKIARSAERTLRVPWAVKLALSHQRERVVIFHERVSEVESISDLLAQFGQNTVTYHSSLSDSHRRDNLRLFRRGIVNMLVTCRALDEGANVPEANVAIVAHSTSSTRQRIQRLGRVLRPAQNKQRAIVYTLFVGDDQRVRLSKEAANLEGVADVSWSRGSIH